MQIPCKCDPKFFLLPLKKKFEKPQYNVLKSKWPLSMATFEERHMKEKDLFQEELPVCTLLSLTFCKNSSCDNEVCH